MSEKKAKKKLKSKLTENFTSKSCRKSQKVPKFSKVAEQLVVGLFHNQQLLFKISLPRFLCVKKEVQMQMQKICR